MAWLMVSQQVVAKGATMVALRADKKDWTLAGKMVVSLEAL